MHYPAAAAALALSLAGHASAQPTGAEWIGAPHFIRHAAALQCQPGALLFLASQLSHSRHDAV